METSVGYFLEMQVKHNLQKHHTCAFISTTNNNNTGGHLFRKVPCSMSFLHIGEFQSLYNNTQMEMQSISQNTINKSKLFTFSRGFIIWRKDTILKIHHANQIWIF